MSVPATITSDPAGLLPASYWEHVWDGCRLPQTIRAAAIPDEDRLFRRFLPDRGPDTALAEIGCAPGKWLHYFATEFGYSVTGIDYAPNACETTRRNLDLLETAGTVVNADVFQYTSPGDGFDVVVSVGLIEHFDDLSAIVERLVGLAKPGGLIVSIVPNLYGPEGWVLKTVRPKVYAGHVPIRLHEFRQLHESAGAETMFSNYLGGCFFTPPLRGTEFARNRPRLAMLANLPAIGMNRLARYAQVATGIFPRLRSVSPKLIHIGRRRTA
jgi:2-polyprenyl-3-methyl-5-hydroxy-6-metoxy-1,4-benzoquinol methylase